MIRRKAILSLALLPGCLPSWLAAAPETEVLLLKQTFNKEGAEGPPPRFQQALFHYLEKELGLRFDIQPYPWKRAQALAEQGKGLIWGMSATAGRRALFDFSVPVRTNDIWMVTRAGEGFTCQGIEDLSGKVVSVFRGNVYGDAFEQHRGRLFHVEEDIDFTSIRLRKLMARRVDVVLLSTHNKTREQVQHMLDKLSDRPGQVTVLDKPLIKDPVHFAYAKHANKQALLARINVAINKARVRGDLNRFASPG
ncbi:transporter substrate-binding domain-containing protein [Chitinivorax sp. B]|uniref:substrate-binding periplasmic protein n=1 Tax=Chitinivorax sp. B TaxID=2502235 RepID=UPI0010F7AE62|nr:transporter substrate-binding domain-containing protein [Chitinivorax sp. B]